MATPDQPSLRIVSVLVVVGLIATVGLQILMDFEPKEAGPGSRVNLEEIIPRAYGNAVGKPVPVTEAVVDRLAAERFLFRQYQAPGEPTVWLWVGFYANQRDATVHSPAGCYAGLGWTTSAVAYDAAQLEWPTKWLQITNGDERRLVLYWYETEYGAVGSELQRNLLRLYGRLRGGTRLVFVRISTPEDTQAGAQERLVAMAAWLRPILRAQLRSSG